MLNLKKYNKNNSEQIVIANSKNYIIMSLKQIESKNN